MQENVVDFYNVPDHVRISLTDLAYKVIIGSDLKIFEASSDDHWSKGQFINMLIQNYYGDFDLKPNLLKLHGSKSFGIRLNKSTVNLIYGIDRHYQDAIKFASEIKTDKFECPQFINCLLETYARLPFIEREKLILKNSVIKPISEAISNSEGKKLSIIYAHDDKIYKVSPVCIAPAKEGTFQYLICTHDDGSVESLRLSRIKVINELKEKKTPLSESVFKKITEDLAEFGPTFIKEKEVTVKVRLTQSGILKYAYAVMHRPMHVDVEHILDDKEGEDVFVFRCSEKQALFFFFRFAGEAEILEPQSLRDKFRYLYQSGLNNYL